MLLRKFEKLDVVRCAADADHAQASFASEIRGKQTLAGDAASVQIDFFPVLTVFIHDMIGCKPAYFAAESRDARVGGYGGEMPRRQREVPLAARVTEEDRAAHRQFVLTLGDRPIWNDFLNDFSGSAPSLA